MISVCLNIQGEKLTIIAFNDTHSAIQPAQDDNLGGFLRRKAVVDSIKAVSPNTVVVHAGDAVQGSLYFSLFAGKVEFPLLNMMPYDYIIMGNHEFDNGIE